MTPRPTHWLNPTNSAELDAIGDNLTTEWFDAGSPFVVKRIPDAEKAAAPVAEWTINAQGIILNAKFQSARTQDAEAIGRFIADHNGKMAELRVNSRLGDLR